MSKGRTQIGDLLRAAYDRAAGVLASIDGVLAWTDAGPTPFVTPSDARPVIEVLHRFLSEDFFRHLAFEQQSLCPALAGAGLPRLSEILRSEHAELRPLALRLQALCSTALGEGVGGSLDREAWIALRSLSRDFAGQMKAHLQAEHSIVLAAVEDLLGPEADRALVAAYLEGEPDSVRGAFREITEQPSIQENAA